MKPIFFFFFIVAYTVTAQTTNDLLYLDITFPSKSDTVNADKVRLSGHTLPNAILRINGQKIDLYPQGSFATRVDLDEGMNQIIVVAQQGDQIVRDILFIFRPETLKNLQPQPTIIDRVLVEPREDIWKMNGDYLTVKFKGSPGGRAQFRVEKLGKDFPMVELSSHETNGITGIYAGTIKLQGAPYDKALEIEFELSGQDNKRKRLTAPGKLTILPDNIPVIGQTIKPSFIHAAAHGYAPITRIPDSVKVHVIGRDGTRYKIDLLNRSGFIETRDIHLLTFGSPRPLTTISAPHINQDKDWLYLVMPIGERLPFQTTAGANPHTVELTVWGARQASHWITYPNTAIDLVNLVLSQADEHVFKLSVELKQQRAWGHKVFYKNGALHLAIRRQPMLDPANPVKNLIFAIDPGHGGEETGATSPLGTYEKDVNRLWADELLKLLWRNGAYAIKTREDDETVSLEERIELAEKANAHFFISLHNNATTAYGNPLSANGTSVYFTLPQNKDLSWAIYPNMVKLGLAPYGRIHNSYFVTNATGFLVSLVEGGFLTHPEEELKLSDMEFIKKMARAVYDGIVEFLQSQK
ncbi:N-acetylmuramoyl-L-alanine amidase [candidate division KSB1 bacterium]|nr:N-acetylmuramoyl-L-alanine amidase [candidate division KSB1 bacterium]